MIKKSILLCIAVLALCSFALAADTSFTGTVSDDHCGVKHAKAGAAAAECVKKCVAGGAKYVLVSKGKIYQLDPQDKFADYAGQRVKVTGSMSAETITATDVAPVGGPTKKM